MTEDDWQTCEDPESMNEEEWLTGESPSAMLEFLCGKVSERKLRLFACACCRRIWHLLTDARSRRAVEIAEQYTDGLTSEEKMSEACTAAWEVPDSTEHAPAAAAETAYSHLAGLFTARSIAENAASAAGGPPPAGDGDWEDRARECKQQAILLRHLVDNPFRPHLPFGWHEPTLFDQLDFNPFRPYPAPGQWPRAVIDLAEAVYAGEDCAFVLHDALAEAGFDDLAEHFREASHPKGCWVVDLILGKE